MNDCSEKLSAEGTLECGSPSYRRSLAFQGGSFAAALQGCASARVQTERSVSTWGLRDRGHHEDQVIGDFKRWRTGRRK